MLSIPITKTKTATGFKTLEVDPNEFTDEVFQYLLAEGLKAVLNSRMTKVGAVTKLIGKELEKAHADAMAIAQENLDDLKAGKIKHTRGKSKSTIPTIVRAEAMRLAKTAIKDAVRAQGYKPSHFSEKAYTALAKERIEADPSFIDQARENIEARKTPQFKLELNIADLGPQVSKSKKEDKLPAGVVATHRKGETTFQPGTHAKH